MLILLTALLLSARAQEPKPTEVVVVSTLHLFHNEVPGYSLETLGRLIERVAPDALCVELSQEDLDRPGPQAEKIEYPKVILPYARRRGLPLYPMEPSGPERSRLLAAGEGESRGKTDGRAYARRELFKEYSEVLLETLKARWKGPAEVNSEATDLALEVKQRFRVRAYGPGSAQLWEGWNRSFQAAVEKAAREHPGGRILVTAGAEHGWWLRAKLGRVPGLRLRPASDFLDAP